MNPSSDTATVIQSVRRYFEQMAEVYGNDLILSEPDVLSKLAQTADSEDLDAFHTAIQDCQKCPLGKTRNKFVFGAGNPAANLMLIGEAPGEEEDQKGEPFVGKAGQLLDKILEAIGFRRDEIYIANILKCRPPQNRDPGPEEIQTCLPYLERQIALIQPKIILVLGRIAAHTLLDSKASLTQLRGSVHRYRDVPLFVTYHPAALLRNPEWKRPTWEDVQKLRKTYDEIVGDKSRWMPPNKK
jgi:uracil-DNA glycosylase family 4